MKGVSFGSLGLRLGRDARISCMTFPDEPGTSPILVLDLGALTVCLHPGSLVSPALGDLASARVLAEAVYVYVAEIERLTSEAARKGGGRPTEHDRRGLSGPGGGVGAV